MIERASERTGSTTNAEITGSACSSCAGLFVVIWTAHERTSCTADERTSTNAAYCGVLCPASTKFHPPEDFSLPSRSTMCCWKYRLCACATGQTLDYRRI